jgi:hypothetical protein
MLLFLLQLTLVWTTIVFLPVILVLLYFNLPRRAILSLY